MSLSPCRRARVIMLTLLKVSLLFAQICLRQTSYLRHAVNGDEGNDSIPWHREIISA